MPRILLVEDDAQIGDGVRAGLQHYGIQVDWLTDAKKAMSALNHDRFDAVVLDLGLPQGDGMIILAHWREQGYDIPVLIMTARDAIEDRVAGLNAGADDYVIKPVALAELVARLQALIRRQQGRSQPEVRHTLENICIRYNATTQEVHVNDERVELTQRELMVLSRLLEHPKQTYTRVQLEDSIYGWDDGASSNSVEVHIHHLRKKLGNHVIITKRGMGYCLNPDFISS